MSLADTIVAYYAQKGVYSVHKDLKVLSGALKYIVAHLEECTYFSTGEYTSVPVATISVSITMELAMIQLAGN